MPGADDVLAEAGARLAAVVVAAVPRWVSGAVATALAAAGRPTDEALQHDAQDAGTAAAARVGEELDALARADVDAQRTTPLEILRGAVVFPTEVLRRAGLAPVARDRFAEERFPDDPYGLMPASLAVLGAEAGEAALVWGAAKAAAHRSRHGGSGRAPR
ncbi:MAG: hypothetical protein ACYDA2_06365 [Acidimicrobiales bacterium]